MPNTTCPGIRGKARALAKDRADVTSERAEAQPFWNTVFAIFGVAPRFAKIIFEKDDTRRAGGAADDPRAETAQHEASDPLPLL